MSDPGLYSVAMLQASSAMVNLGDVLLNTINLFKLLGDVIYRSMGALNSTIVEIFKVTQLSSGLSSAYQSADNASIALNNFTASLISSGSTVSTGDGGTIFTTGGKLKGNIWEGMKEGAQTGATLGSLTPKFGADSQFGSLLGKYGAMMGGGIGGVAGGMGAAFSSLGPQMLALTLAIKPIMALIQGILEPFDIIIELFGAIGQIIGLLLIPIIMPIAKMLIAMMPPIMAIVQMLIPLIDIIALPLTLIAFLLQIAMPVITIIATALGWVTNLIQIVINWIKRALDWLGSLFSGWVGGGTNTINNSSTSLSTQSMAGWQI